MAIGILTSSQEVHLYHGVDVSERSICWCRRYIQSYHSNLRFLHVDVLNARYHPDGRPIARDFALPMDVGSFDIVYLFSVFSHMPTADLKAYLQEFARLLVAEGRVFFTAFVEQGVPPMSVNPSDYGMTWRGPLHCVRYERQFLFGLVRQAGFQADEFEHAAEANGQSGVYLTKRTSDQ